MSRQSPFNPINTALLQDSARSISSIDPKLSRTNYFDGRLLKASDLIRDQLYLDERLREVGRALGQGIVRGLELSLSATGLLEVSPGLALAPSGRILELEQDTLSINLHDTAKIASLNEGFRYFQRGLYAVVLHYAEKGEGSAEIYPRDLDGERGFHFNAFAEGVEIILEPLQTKLPNRVRLEAERLNRDLASRAALVRELINPARLPAEISEDGIALGLLAIENGQAQWLDRGLLRRPYRNVRALNTRQADLHVHYQELLGEVLQLRFQSTRQEHFPAAHYFELMPPYGTIPKDCVDPENGYQSFFPEGFEVSIAPMREDDLDAVIAQSAALEVIDLRADKDVDIMVLVPMSDHQFAWRARQLQHQPAAGSKHTQLLHIDSFALRLYGAPSVHEANTDAAVWRDIWASTRDVIYVRRPTRVAETQVSAVVLATGYTLPDTVTALPPNIEVVESERDTLAERVSELEDENTELRDDLARDPDEALAEAEVLIATLRAEIAALQTALEEAQGDDERLAAIIAERDVLQAELARTAAGISALETSNASLRAQIASLSRQLERARALIAELQNDDGDGGRVNPTPPVRIDTLLKWRGVRDARAIEAARNLAELIGDDQQRLMLVNQIVMLAGRQYDPLLWPSLLPIARQRRLAEFHRLVSETSDQPLEIVMAKRIARFGVPADIVAGWQRLARSSSGGGAPIPGGDTPRVPGGAIRPRDPLLGGGIPEILAGGNLVDHTIDLDTGVTDARIVEANLSGSNDIAAARNLRAADMRSVQELAARVGITDARVIARVEKVVADDGAALLLVNQLVTMVNPVYSQALWGSFPTLARNGQLEEFFDFVVDTSERRLPLGLAVAASISRFGLSSAQRSGWSKIDMAE